MTSLSEIYAAITTLVQAENAQTKNVSTALIPSGYMSVTSSSGATVFIPYYDTVPS
jgi:hypothetical protein